MNLIRLVTVTHYYSERTLLDEVDLLINSGDRIGLVGRNGSGKTTLLHLIAGLESPRSGNVQRWGGVRVQYLPQEPELDPAQTVLDTLFASGDPQVQLLRKYESVSEQLRLEPQQKELQARFAAISAEMDRRRGWAAEAKAKAILTRLGITQFQARIDTLSGGQHKRVALAHALIDPGDLLILDEPTNHIDVETISWLEQFLVDFEGALLMVTHDRYFLSRVVNKIVELDRRKLVTYTGNYGRYLEKRTAREQQLQGAELKRQALLRRELEWIRRGPLARGTKQKARQQRVKELQEISYDHGDQRVAIALAGRRLGKQVLEAQGLCKAYDEKLLFADLDFHLNPGDRIGIVGPNGAGKSTFLDLLAGYTAPDAGSLRWGASVGLGYYDQQSRHLDEGKKVHAYIADQAPLIRTAGGERVEAAQMLEWFLFSRPEQQAQIGSLSGGEKRRLYLLRTLVLQPNVLFLDEPTNDLDVETLAVLEQFLDHFTGCLVVVSHDRYFLDRNVDFLMIFEDGLLGSRLPTPFENARARLAKSAVDTPAHLSVLQEKPEPTRKKKVGSRKMSFHEKKELAALEVELPRMEEQIAKLEKAINGVGQDYQRLKTLADDLQAARAVLETTEHRWLELMEIAE